MKKKILIVLMLVATIALFADGLKLETRVYSLTDKESGTSAKIYMTKLISTDYWTEYYLLYEEDSNTYDEADAQKIVYEFITKFKIDNKFSKVDTEELNAANTSKKKGKTILDYRCIFRQLRK